MSFCIGNKIEMRKRALLEAIRFCGGVTGFSKRLKVSRPRASNWVNKPEIEIPYEYVVLIEAITQVSIERLSPNTEAANKVIRALRAQNKFAPLFVEISSILVADHFYSCAKPGRPIIVGTDGLLISGLSELEAQKSSKQRKIQVTLLDLEAIALGHRSLNETNLELLVSEKVALGIRLEQVLGKHQGARNDIKESPKLIKKIIDDSELCPKWDKVERLDSYVAHLIDLKSKNTYQRAKQVYLQGNLDLIHAMDQRQISIAMAAQNLKILKSPNKLKFNPQ